MAHTYVGLSDAVVLLLARLRTHCGTKDITISITDPSYVPQTMESNGKSTSISIGSCFFLMLKFYIATAASMPKVISSTTKEIVVLHHLEFVCLLPSGLEI